MRSFPLTTQYPGGNDYGQTHDQPGYYFFNKSHLHMVLVKDCGSENNKIFRFLL